MENDPRRRLVEKIRRGDVAAAARLIRDIDNEAPAARPILKALYAHTGKAHIVGITGSAGVGKSTLTAGLTRIARNSGRSVGVIAVDPTSSRTGGAILGDRIRMRRHADDDAVFIRSLAGRGHGAGLSHAAYGAITVMDAMGKDIVFVESVGAGQDEVEIAHLVQTTVVVLAPNMGDSVQSFKAGIMESADIFVVNKSDLAGADRTAADIRNLLDTASPVSAAWMPVVLCVSALKNETLAPLMQTLDRHRKCRAARAGRLHRRRMFAVLGLLLRHLVWRELEDRIVNEGTCNALVDEICRRETDPYSAAEKLKRRLMS